MADRRSGSWLPSSVSSIDRVSSTHLHMEWLHGIRNFVLASVSRDMQQFHQSRSFRANSLHQSILAACIERKLQ